MNGMDRNTGAPLSGDAHLAQSIGDILNTPIGSRVMRRTYGSRLPDLIDAPANPATMVQLYAATATALMRWEPRITLQRVSLSAIDAKNGRFQLALAGQKTDTGAAVALDIPLQLGSAA